MLAASPRERHLRLSLVVVATPGFPWRRNVVLPSPAEGGSSDAGPTTKELP